MSSDDSCSAKVVNDAVEPKKRWVFIDYLRILCVLGVICIHVPANCLSYPQVGLAEQLRNVLAFVTSVMRWSVPVFLMITGMLFWGQDKECTYRSLYSHILRFVLVLLIIGTGFCLMEQVYISRKLNLEVIGISLKEMLCGNSWAHMWYVYRIIGIYMFLPVFKPFFMTATRKELGIFAAAVFIMSIILPQMENYIGFEIRVGTRGFDLFSYVVMGGVIGKLSPCIRSCRKRMLWVSVLAIVLGVAMVARRFALVHGDFVAGYTSIPTYVVTVGLFLLFFLLNDQLAENVWVVRVAQCSWGIYLIHPVFINMLFKVVKYNPAEHCPVVLVPLTVLALFVISFFIIYLLRKITLLRKYLL